MGYWEERTAKEQAKLTEKSRKEINKQMKNYYKIALNNTQGDFLLTLNKILAQKNKGKEITPALIYKLDSYWNLQAQVRKNLNKLGEKQVALMNEQFINHWKYIYQSIPLRDKGNFSKLDDKAIKQLINGIWCADGKSWSERIWKNTERLQATLNHELVKIIVAGAEPEQLKDMLAFEFSVSYNQADTVVRTELVHIQTESALQRYKDAGVDKVEILADEDERRCDICGKLHGKQFYIGEKIPIPAHPRCRCCVVPVIDKQMKMTF